jgi:hypothetical protein
MERCLGTKSAVTNFDSQAELKIKSNGLMFEEKNGMFMWRTTISQRTPEIIIHRECAAEAGRRNIGRTSLNAAPSPFWKNRH